MQSQNGGPVKHVFLVSFVLEDMKILAGIYSFNVELYKFWGEINQPNSFLWK
jgi:hypothetical protein